MLLIFNLSLSWNMIAIVAYGCDVFQSQTIIIHVYFCMQLITVNDCNINVWGLQKYSLTP